jgi:integrase
MENITFEFATGMKSIKPKKKLRVKKKRWVLNAQMRKDLLSYVKKKNVKHYFMIRVLFELGLRAGELVNLRVKDINFYSGKVFVCVHEGPKTLKWSPKYLSVRELDIVNPLKNDLFNFIDDRKGNDYIFQSRQGGSRFRVDSVIRMINRYTNRVPSIGKNTGSHVGRRTFLSFLNANNVNLNEIRKKAGHRHLKTTLEYIKDLDNEDDQTVRKLIGKMNSRLP